MALQLGQHEQQQQQLGLSEGGDNNSNSSKAPRLPRWTRQEILVLIQGKRVAETRVRRGRTAALACGGSAQPVEPKWATVSSYCRRHGVNRGPVQCRKRWSNLAADFKKIKDWEAQIRDDSDSFWLMRNDLRRERKLPGFFDREVYDILHGTSSGPGPPDPEPDEMKPVDEEPVFDSGRSAAADDGLFSDFEQSGQDQDPDDTARSPDPVPHKEIDDPPSAVPIPIPAPTPISEKQYQPNSGEAMGPGTNGKQPAAGLNINKTPEIGSTSREGRKRRRFVEQDEGEGEGEDEAASLQDQLIQVLERNGKLLSAQLEAQNINLKLDREERKDHATSLVAVLNKLADALGRIADKL